MKSLMSFVSHLWLHTPSINIISFQLEKSSLFNVEKNYGWWKCQELVILFQASLET